MCIAISPMVTIIMGIFFYCCPIFQKDVREIASSRSVVGDLWGELTTNMLMLERKGPQSNFINMYKEQGMDLRIG